MRPLVILTFLRIPQGPVMRQFLSADLGLGTGPEKKPTFNDWAVLMILPSLFYIVNFFPVAFKCRQLSLLRNKTQAEAATHSPSSRCSISLSVLTMKLTQNASLLATVSSLSSSTPQILVSGPLPPPKGLL